MIQWLESVIGATASSDFAFITYISGAVLSVLLVVLVSSMLFGIATNIFKQ